MARPQPTVVIAGSPTWAEAVRSQLAGDYRVLQQMQPDGYMNTLINALAALVLVDGDSAGWEAWTTTPKTSPATRRIPIVLVSSQDALRTRALATGADLTTTPDELEGNLAQFLRDFGRLPDPDQLAQLDCECQEPLPELAQQGVEKFNAGEYYKQHDLFEAQWVATAGPVRDLYRAVLQVGVAYFQIQRGNYRGALKMLQRSVQWLLILPDVCQGINVKRLREESFQVRAELERLGEDRFSEFDHTLIGGVSLVEPPQPD